MNILISVSQNKHVSIERERKTVKNVFKSNDGHKRLEVQYFWVSKSFQYKHILLQLLYIHVCNGVGLVCNGIGDKSFREIRFVCFFYLRTREKCMPSQDSRHVLTNIHFMLNRNR